MEFAKKHAAAGRAALDAGQRFELLQGAHHAAHFLDSALPQISRLGGTIDDLLVFAAADEAISEASELLRMAYEQGVKGAPLDALRKAVKRSHELLANEPQQATPVAARSITEALSAPPGATPGAAREQQAHDTQGDREARPIPGALEPRKCDDVRSAECWLDERYRERVYNRLGLRALSAAGAFSDAVLKIQLEEKMRPKWKGWAVLVEVFFGLGTRGLGNAVMSLLNAIPVGTPERIQEIAVAFMDPGVFNATMAATTNGAKQHLKDTVGAIETEEALQAFLSGLQDMARQWADSLLDDAAQFGDDELIAVTLFFESANHSTSYYESELKAMIARWRHEVDSIAKPTGPTKQGQHPHRAIRLVGPHGQQRTALVSAPHEHFRRTDPLARSMGVSAYDFVQWISDDMAQMAEETQMARRGELLTLRVDDPLFSGKDHPEIRKWLEDSTPQFERETYRVRER